MEAIFPSLFLFSTYIRIHLEAESESTWAIIPVISYRPCLSVRSTQDSNSNSVILFESSNFQSAESTIFSI